MILLLAAASAEPVAQAILVEGPVFVETGDGRRPLERFGPVESTDTIVTGVEGAVILQLFNDHLVRIDSELDLPLTDMILLTAPRRPQPQVQAQLAQLLYPDERERFGGMVSETESIGGWHARVSASRGFGGAEAKSSAARPLSRGPKLDREQDKGGLPSPPASAAPAGRPSASASPPPPPQLVLPSKPQAPPRTLDEVLAPFAFGSPGFESCTAPWIRELGLEQRLDALTFEVRLEDGAVHRISNDAQLPMPACLREAVLGAPVTTSTPVRIPVR